MHATTGHDVLHRPNHAGVRDPHHVSRLRRSQISERGTHAVEQHLRAFGATETVVREIGHPIVEGAAWHAVPALQFPVAKVHFVQAHVHARSAQVGPHGLQRAHHLLRAQEA
ncbi:hypothetical protein D9M68_815570 [compost metagenome]